MGLFDSVNYVNSQEIKKLYSKYDEKSFKDVDMPTFGDAFEEKEAAPSNHPFMTHLEEENEIYEKAVQELIDDEGCTRKQAEKMLSRIAEESNEKNNTINYITEMTGMSVEEAEEYFNQQKAVDRLQDEIFG